MHNEQFSLLVLLFIIIMDLFLISHLIIKRRSLKVKFYKCYVMPLYVIVVASCELLHHHIVCKCQGWIVLVCTGIIV